MRYARAVACRETVSFFVCVDLVTLARNKKRRSYHQLVITGALLLQYSIFYASKKYISLDVLSQ